MRRLMFALVLLTSARAAQAQAIKIGYVDIQRAVSETEEGKSTRSRLQADVQKKKADLDVKRAALEKMKADFDKQAPVLSDDAKRKKQEELQKAFIEAQNTAQEMEDDLQGKQQEALMSIQKRLLQVVADISDRENFTFVLDKQALLYAPAASDVTNEVVRRYNERFGTGGAAGAPAGKTPEKKPAPAPAPAAKK